MHRTVTEFIGYCSFYRIGGNYLMKFIDEKFFAYQDDNIVFTGPYMQVYIPSFYLEKGCDPKASRLSSHAPSILQGIRLEMITVRCLQLCLRHLTPLSRRSNREPECPGTDSRKWSIPSDDTFRQCLSIPSRCILHKL